MVQQLSSIEKRLTIQYNSSMLHELKTELESRGITLSVIEFNVKLADYIIKPLPLALLCSFNTEEKVYKYRVTVADNKYVIVDGDGLAVARTSAVDYAVDEIIDDVVFSVTSIKGKDK